MTPTKEMKRVFGDDWPEVLDMLEERDPVTITYRQDAEIIGFSYRRDTLCLYVSLNGGERKTIPLTDIIDVEVDE